MLRGIVLSLFLLIAFLVVSQDTIKVCYLLPNSESYLVATNGFKKIYRYQTVTSNLLARYNTEAWEILDLQIADDLNRLIYVTTDSLIQIDLRTGDIIKKTAWPAVVRKAISQSLSYLKGKQISDYFNGQLMICAGSDFFSFNVNTGEVINTFSAVYNAQDFYLIHNGKSLLFTEQISYKLMLVKLPDGKPKEITDVSVSDLLKVNNERTHAFIAGQDKLLWFELNDNGIRRMAIQSYSTAAMGQSDCISFFGNSSTILDSYGFSSFQYYSEG